jgi:hypothetical protein
MPRDLDLAQAEILLLLRAAIDTAMRHPGRINEETALDIARSYPRALRSSRLRRQLGQRRWLWLNDHGVYAQELGIIEPDLRKSEGEHR